MSVKDHMPNSLALRRQARILTVDPAQRRIDAALGDGGGVQIAVYEVPPLFRWPKEGETWLIYQDGGAWRLGQQLESQDLGHRIEDLDPGHVKIQSDVIKTESGNDVVITDQSIATQGSVMTWTTSPDGAWIPTAPEVAGLLTSGDYKHSARVTDHPGWLLADGRVLLRAVYPDLFEAISTTYNIGGELGTQFRVPDRRGQTLVAPDNMGTSQGAAGRVTANNTLGATGGEQAHTLSAAESGLPEHQHHMEVGQFGGSGKNLHNSGGKNFVRGDDVSSGGSGNNAIFRGTDGGFIFALGVGNTFPGPQSASSGHNNLQPYGVANIFIKT